MPSECKFAFDRPEPVYFSGETISGRIELRTTSNKSVRGVYIHFTGEAKVHWEESRTRRQNGKTHRYTEHYRATEAYLNTRTNVFQSGSLPAGTHVYTFCIPLPVECPTSCAQRHGKVSYELSLVLNRPLRFDNVFKQPLTVIRRFDLNENPEYLIPLKAEDIRYFCCWPCASDPCISTVTVPFGAYAPGQTINYVIQIDNQSTGNDTEGVAVKFIQVYKFTARTPSHKTRIESNTIMKMSHDDRCLRLSKRLVKGSLTIPPLPPTTMTSGIIEIIYFMKVAIKSSGCSADGEITFPITIGTVPLIQSAAIVYNAIVVPPTALEMPPTPYSLNDMPPSYDKFKPPSYEGAIVHGGTGQANEKLSS